MFILVQIFFKSSLSFMYLFKIYLFKGQSNTEAEFSLCWFTPQMAGGARFKIGPN